MMSNNNLEAGNTLLDIEVDSGPDTSCRKIEAPGDQLPDPN